MRPDRQYVHQELKALIETLVFENRIPLEMVISALAIELGEVLGSCAKPDMLPMALARTSTVMKDSAYGETQA